MINIRVLMTLAAIALTLASCGRDVSGVLVDSSPRGASILSAEGKPLGLKTPAFIDLDLKIKEHSVLLSMPGYQNVPLSFRKETKVDVISPGEAATSVLCAPCCCGLPLLNLLDPVDVNTFFVPSVSRVELTRTGGGVFITSMPPQVEMVVDTGSRGVVYAGMETFVPVEPGFHDFEFRAAGFESMRLEKVRVDGSDPLRLVVNLKPLSGALCLMNLESSALPLSLLRVLVSDSHREVVRLEPGPGSLTTELAPGNYLMELEGKTTTGKVLSHTESFTVTTGDIVVRQLAQLGPWRQVRAWMGVSLASEGHLTLRTGHGTKTVRLKSSASVSFVAPDSPAFHAGLQAGDTLLTVNGHPFQGGEEGQEGKEGESPNANLQLKRLMVALRPGDPLLVQVLRDDEIVDLKISSLGSEYVNESEMDAVGR